MFTVFPYLLIFLQCLHQPPDSAHLPLTSLSPLFSLSLFLPSLSLILFSLPHSPLVSLASLDFLILRHLSHLAFSSSLKPSITLGLFILPHALHHSWPLSLLNLTWSPLAYSGSLCLHSLCFPQPPLFPHPPLPSMSLLSSSPTVHLDFLSLLTLIAQLSLFSFLFCL